ncbi:MAG: hypothetical protein KF784_00740 [Fimbriimonadaceae bacterium]|nr:hypothetical protein [Fimbriimonadaceae bacterium]
MQPSENIPESRIQWGENCPLTWHPTEGGKRPWIAWDDDKHFELGADPEGLRFELIRERMLSGKYYPPNVIRFYGRFRNEARHLRPGDRIIQKAFLLPSVKELYLWSAAEIFVAESSDTDCRIGYVTTARHFGRGIWQAHLWREDGRLKLQVTSIAGPQHWLFWTFLPIARMIQMKAWRAAVADLQMI